MARYFTPALAASVCALTAAPATAPAVGGQERTDRLERHMIKHVNAQRARHGLKPVRVSRGLAKSADLHSWDMLRRDFFSHVSPSGGTMKARVSRYTRPRKMGETLGFERGTRRRGIAGRIVRAWMRSPGHRAVLLDPGYQRIGLSMRSGSFRSTRATVVTANFSSRR